MSEPFPLPDHPRANINIAHSVGDDHAVTVTYDDTEHGQSHIFVTLQEMPELVRMLTDYVTAAIPQFGLAPDDRFDFEVTLETLQKYLQREQDFQLASTGHGIIAALPSRGQIEFRAVDVDLETQEIRGGRAYRVSPSIAAQWLANNLLCTGHMLALDDLIAIRDTASRFITGKLHHDQQAQKVSALVLNAFAQSGYPLHSPSCD